MTLANDGGPCNDPRTGAEQTQTCEEIWITRDGGANYTLAKKVAHGSSGNFNGYGDLGNLVPSTGLPVGQFRTIVSCFHRTVGCVGQECKALGSRIWGQKMGYGGSRLAESERGVWFSKL